MYPIVVFAYNRRKVLETMISSLKKNAEAPNSDLFVFIDGPKIGNDDDKNRVYEVRDFVRSISGFKTIDIRISDENKGLASSIIEGVSEIINEYGAAIVVEDDLVVQPNFLKFMNEGLRVYENNKDVWSICAYSDKIKVPKNYEYDAYFCPRSSPWGWGTWANRWNSVDWSFNNWEVWKLKKKEFNKWGGSDCFSMLESCKNGLNQSWAIRFRFNQFLQNKLSLFPVKSLVKNDGFDGSGTNCRKYSRFKCELMNPERKRFHLPTTIEINKSIRRQAMRYNSIPIRIWSRIMYKIIG